MEFAFLGRMVGVKVCLPVSAVKLHLWIFDPRLSYRSPCTPAQISLLFLLPECRTIVYLSIVYTAGQIILAVAAIHDITDTNRDGKPDNMAFHV